MPEIGTSGSMSGEWKRSVAEWPKLPRPSSTLPFRTWRSCWMMSVHRVPGQSGNYLLAPSISHFDPFRTWGIAGRRPTIVLYEHSISPSRGCILSSEPVERRLTAILAADVAGYSRLIGADEEGTLAQLKAFRKTLFDPTI